MSARILVLSAAILRRLKTGMRVAYIQSSIAKVQPFNAIMGWRRAGICVVDIVMGVRDGFVEAERL
jgi:hypothetical protein